MRADLALVQQYGTVLEEADAAIPAGDLAKMLAREPAALERS